MNKSNLMHGLVAVAVTLAFALIGHAMFGATSAMFGAGFGMFGAGLGIGFYLGREHSQREAKLGGPYKVGPLAGFTGWSKDAWGDFLAPLAASLAVIFLMRL